MHPHGNWSINKLKQRDKMQWTKKHFSCTRKGMICKIRKGTKRHNKTNRKILTLHQNENSHCLTNTSSRNRGIPMKSWSEKCSRNQEKFTSTSNHHQHHTHASDELSHDLLKLAMVENLFHLFSSAEIHSRVKENTQLWNIENQTLSSHGCVKCTHFLWQNSLLCHSGYITMSIKTYHDSDSLVSSEYMSEYMNIHTCQNIWT